MNIEETTNYWISEETYELLNLPEKKIFKINNELITLNLNGYSNYKIDNNLNNQLKFRYDNLFDQVFYSFW